MNTPKELEKMVETIYKIFPFVSISCSYLEIFDEWEVKAKWYARGEQKCLARICNIYLNDFDLWVDYTIKELLCAITRSLYEVEK